jgi:hypothetical protein
MTILLEEEKETKIVKINFLVKIAFLLEMLLIDVKIYGEMNNMKQKRELKLRESDELYLHYSMHKILNLSFIL